ncbi:MAG: serine--tRNA ligase [Candidatus Omnitrophota bacterium]|nr:MAG: serine--tRNA ligase [Candidatus Omnitrophota bacterium]
MLDIKFIRENPKEVKKAIKDRGLKLDLDALLELDAQKRKLTTEMEELKCKKNLLSEQIAQMMVGQKVGAKDLVSDAKTLSQKIAQIKQKVEEVEPELSNMLLNVPNICHKSVPVGSGPRNNKIVRSWGKPLKPTFKLRNQLELAEHLGIIDFTRASKIAGSNFVLFMGQGARLERALYNFMLDLHTKKHGYTEVFPPFLVNRASMTGTGQLPKLEEDMYRLKDDDYFLVPTAEVPVTNIHRNEVFKEEELPKYYTAYTACFRREAGSYGKDTRGLTRVHQFDKVELVKFVKPEGSFEELESLLKDAEEVLQLLEIPYRVVILCTGEVSFAAAKCYDLEAWAPASNMWLEVSSCSNFTDFQARRANIKYRRTTTGEQRKTEYVHTLNGSGVALARTLIALLENHQKSDGSVSIPKALVPYMDGKTEIKP